MDEGLGGLKQLSLIHVIKDQYHVNRGRGTLHSSYGITKVSKHPDAPVACMYAAYILMAFTIPYNWLIAILLFPVYWLCIAAGLALADTYCTIKDRRRIKLKHTINWMFDPDNGKKNRPWWMH